MTRDDRRDVADKTKTEIWIECGVEAIRSGNLSQRIAIGGCFHDRLSANVAAGAGTVLDDELLAKPIRQPLAYEACQDVGSPACGKPDNNPHRSRRIGLPRAT